MAMATATVVQASSDDSETSLRKEGKRKDVMAFLRKKGAVGRNQDFSTAMVRILRYRSLYLCLFLILFLKC